MIMKGFTVWDSAANAFLPIFFQQTRGLAVRSFTSAVNDPKHQFHEHVRDYTLFELCEFDDTTGVIKSDGPVQVCTASDVLMKDLNPTTGSSPSR